jgi:hypothetical protein
MRRVLLRPLLVSICYSSYKNPPENGKVEISMPEIPKEINVTLGR